MATMATGEVIPPDTTRSTAGITEIAIGATAATMSGVFPFIPRPIIAPLTTNHGIFRPYHGAAGRCIAGASGITTRMATTIAPIIVTTARSSSSFDSNQTQTQQPPVGLVRRGGFVVFHKAPFSGAF